MNGFQEGGLHRVTGRPAQGLVHDSINLYELWNQIFCPPIALLELQIDMIVHVEVVHLVRIPRVPFQTMIVDLRGSWDLVYLDVCGPMSISSLVLFLYYVNFIDDFS